jgi:BON domain-containing protein
VEKDYEDIRDIDHLTDNELRAVVRDEFGAQLAFDPDDVDVSVSTGVVRLSGRVGTAEELRIVERVVTDLVGIERVKNELVVDPIRRAESPEPIDEHLVDEELHEGILLGDMARNEDPEAEHLHENIRAELFGTTDVQQAIEGAIPWNPPDGPTPEGIDGSEDTPSELREDL